MLFMVLVRGRGSLIWRELDTEGEDDGACR